MWSFLSPSLLPLPGQFYTTTSATFERPSAFSSLGFFLGHPCLTPSGQPEVAAKGRAWGLLKSWTPTPCLEGPSANTQSRLWSTAGDEAAFVNLLAYSWVLAVASSTFPDSVG